VVGEKIVQIGNLQPQLRRKGANIGEGVRFSTVRPRTEEGLFSFNFKEKRRNRKIETKLGWEDRGYSVSLNFEDTRWGWGSEQGACRIGGSASKSRGGGNENNLRLKNGMAVN